MRIRFLILLPLAALLSSCNSLNLTLSTMVKGKGSIQTRSIENLSDFNNIQISDGMTVELTEGTTNSAIVKAHENLLKAIKVTVKNNTLHINASKGFFNARKEKVFITFKKIEKLNINSGCSVMNKGTINSKNLSVLVHSGAYAKLNTVSDYLNCEVHSGAKLDIEGFSNLSDIKVHSGASINASNLKAKKVNGIAQGGSNLKIYASEVFNGNIEGGSHISFTGNTTSVSAN